MAKIEPTPAPDPDPIISKQVQLKVLDEVVATVKKVYLYPDFNGVDWPGLVAKTRTLVSGGLDTGQFYEEMYNLIRALKDDHSQFQSPSLVALEKEELSGHNDYVGIGILVQPMIKKGRVSIVSVFPGSPAEYRGLKAHDSILTIDGLPAVENGQAQTWRVRGPQCSATVLKVQSPGEEPRLVLLMRSRITTSVPVTARLVKTSDGSRIGYIFLPSFFDETIPGQVRAAMKEFGNLDGLVIDNRQNGGGASNIVEPILNLFIQGKAGAFVTRKTRTETTIKADPINNSLEVPLVVLVGEDTVSYGEIFSGILQDTGRAKIAGQTTLGNVEVLHSYSFDDGSRIWIAEERFDPPVSHTDWEKDGIRPDLEAYADWDTFTFETDPGIKAALKLLGHP